MQTLDVLTRETDLGPGRQPNEDPVATDVIESGFGPRSCEARLAPNPGRQGFGGAPGIEEPLRYAGIVAHPRTEALLGRAAGVDIAFGIRDLGKRKNQLPYAATPLVERGSAGGGSRARSPSIHSRSAARAALSSACANSAMMWSATP